MAAADYRIMTDATGQRIATALEAQSIDKAAKADLTSISATGTTNATGATIAAGTFFYLNGTLVRAKSDIASGATFTSGTNYEAVTAGGLNALNIKTKSVSGTTTTEGTINTNLANNGHNFPLCFVPDSGSYVFLFNPTQYWWMKVMQSSNWTAVSNTSISGTLYYLTL